MPFKDNGIPNSSGWVQETIKQKNGDERTNLHIYHSTPWAAHLRVSDKYNTVVLVLWKSLYQAFGLWFQRSPSLSYDGNTDLTGICTFCETSYGFIW
jgi:hypothetical protein